MAKGLTTVMEPVLAMQDIGDLIVAAFPKTATMELITVTERVLAMLAGEIQIVHVKPVLLIVMVMGPVIAMELAPVIQATGVRIVTVLQLIVMVKVLIIVMGLVHVFLDFGDLTAVV
jgi:hypothetical protein